MSLCKYISKTCTWIKDDIILLLKFNVGGFSFKVLCRFNDRRTQGQWSQKGITMSILYTHFKEL